MVILHARWLPPLAAACVLGVILAMLFRTPPVEDSEVMALALVGDGPALERLIEDDPERIHIGDQRTGMRLIHCMVRGGAAGALRAAMEHGADPGVADRFGMNAFHHLLAGSQREDSEVAAMLAILAEKPDALSAGDQQGMTPLHMAAQLGLAGCTRALLDAGASHSAQDRDGNTPLHFAIQARHPEVEKLLRAAGADATIRNRAGIPASSMASSPSAR